MKMAFTILALLVLSMPAKTQLADYDQYPVYTGEDLGFTYSKQESRLRIWSPPASAAELIFYQAGEGGESIRRIPMIKSDQGTWTAVMNEDLLGLFYTVRVQINHQWLPETTDPYARAVGVNGKRAMVVDLARTNPVHWEKDRSPSFGAPTDAVIYELHLRDVSMSEHSGIRAKGKFAGLTETGTVNPGGLSTGLDHIKELGVTHIHLLPFFDFLSVNESRLDSAQYNWGYDPLNYNTPEGSYSSNPFDGAVRIRELKALIASLHSNGLRIVMDVVYNHTGLTDSSSFNRLVPGYYYRHDARGSFSNATACGNETASERYMMRKFMIESLLFWVKEYHVDGFRFDLMGVHDIETMNLASKALHAIRPDILLYGEGWTAGASPLPEERRAVKRLASRLDQIAVFSDDIRDGIKGSVFREKERGFATGLPGLEESIKFGVVASCQHPQVNYKKVNYSKSAYAKDPGNTITYAECHDNHTLWDKLTLSATTSTETARREMQKLALSIVLTSQGIPFLHAGGEFLRSKHGHENSYNAGDSVNAIDWTLKTVNRDVYEYIKGLIAMRRSHPAFRMRSKRQVAGNLAFTNDNVPGLVAFVIKGRELGDSWSQVYVSYNGNNNKLVVKLPAGEWKLFSEGNKISTDSLKVKGSMTMDAFSCSILYQQD